MQRKTLWTTMGWGLVLLIVTLAGAGTGQEGDKCGFNEAYARQLQKQLGSNWGYGYMDLLADLQKWEQSPYVRIDSIGASVQGRTLWQLTITQDSPAKTSGKHTIFIHARTHPSEVQAFWVTNEIINLLTSESGFARTLREQCVFYIIPMYNPDGVELGYARQNANGVDLESNWDAATPEPEVQALRKRFTELMNSSNPIEVALNMHSSYLCKRYFVYHHENGTSKAYTDLEKEFIGDVRRYFSKIENWDYFVSWTNGTPSVYPESWFWNHYQEAVMALTYEDMHCDSAGEYDSTAYALLHGIADYLHLDLTGILAAQPQQHSLPLRFGAVFPNPVNRTSTGQVRVNYQVNKAMPVTLEVVDILGRIKARYPFGVQIPGNYAVVLPVHAWSSGMYFLRLSSGHQQVVQKLQIIQ